MAVQEQTFKMQILAQPQVGTSAMFCALKLEVCNGTQTTCEENEPATVPYRYFRREIRIWCIFKDIEGVSTFSN